MRRPLLPSAGRGVLLACCAWLVAAPAQAQTPSISSVSPAVVSSDVTLRLTGTGFGSTTATNAVTFVGASGTTVPAVVTAVSAADSTGTLRRVSVRVPTGLGLGRAQITLRNTSTGLTSAPAAAEIVAISSGLATVTAGTTVDLPITLQGNAALDATSNRVTAGTGVTVTRVTVQSATQAIANLTVAPTATIGPRTLGLLTPIISAAAVNAFQVVTAPPNGPPQITSQASTTARAERAYEYQVVATDPDNDPLSFLLPTAPSGMLISPAGLVTWMPAAGQAGEHDVTVEVRDPANNTARQTYRITVSPPATLQSLTVTPESIDLTAAGAAGDLTVTGVLSDGSSLDLTAAASGTTYETSHAAVATVSADGVVTAVADGTATITARNAGLSATTQVTVAIPPSLTALALSPRRTTLRAAGATIALTLTGTFSDGSTRDLTASPDVIYESSAAAVVTIGATGLVTAIGTGSAVVTARVGAVSAQSDVDVVIDSGTGFVQGEVFDDRTGLPLGGATVTVLLEGGVQPQLPKTVTADDRGRYVLPVAAGQVLVRIEKAGATTVDRAGTVPSDAVTTLLDARLTPRDTRTTALQAVFGGRARNLAGTVTLDVPAGGLGADTALVLTEISNQGLAGRLPLGWSPVGGVEIGPATARFEVPATLRLPNADGLAPQASVVMAFYDTVRRAWVAVEPAKVSADGSAIVAALQQPGQFVALVADAAPFTPPAPVTGEMLAGVGEQMFPAGLTARGVVVPRSAPPGDAARAAGTVLLISPSALPSGLVVRAHVSEQFDLLDQSRVVPLPYTQDLVVYARPRLADDMTLGTRLPITPSRSFTIQQLALGTVGLDVRTDPAGEAGGIVTSTGGSLAGPDGILLDVPAGAVPADTVVGLASLLPSQVPVAVAPGFSVLGAVSVALVGAQFGAPAELSILRPASLDAASQVWLGQVFADPFGVSRLRLAGAVEIQASRLVARAIFAGVPLAGVRGAGTYVFVRAAEPLGLLAGTIRQPAGLSPQAGVLATADTAPFADLSAGDGRALLAGRVGVATRVTANDAATGNGGETSTTVPAVQTPAEFTLTLGVVAPSVISTSPAANAANVPLDSTITVFFSEPIAAASITDASAVLAVGGQPVAATRVLSADRRRLTVRPDAPLAGNSVHVLTLTSALQDDGGNGLAAFTPVSFRTLDPSKPPQPAAGQLTAELPDEDGFVLVTATAGVAEPGSAVTATNPRTQESVTVLALADGSFRLRVGAVDGDELTITLRDASGRDFATTLAQFTGADGTTSIGRSGGTVEGPGGRKGRILARALTTAGRFRLTDASAAGLPPLPASLSYLDQFTLATGAARFNTLQSLTLAESQNRFTPAIVTDAPFGAAGSLGVPADFLAGAALRFTATAVDAAGNRAAATAQTLVVASSADTTAAEASSAAQFPQTFVTAPKQALPNQQVDASAVAPSARVEIQIQAPPPPLPDGTTVLLARTLEVDGETKLALVDRLSPAMDGTDAVLGGAGRDLTGVAREGTYAAVAITVPVVFVTGRLTGPPALVTVDGLPFVVETAGPNARFVVPVLANTLFTLRFLDATTLAALGTFNGSATGTPTDIGSPLGGPTATMTVTATPDAHSVVDIAQPIVFTFSEPIAGATVTANAFVVTDPAGSRVPGAVAVSEDDTQVAFTPSRRWRFATRYRYGVGQSVVATSGARLAAPFSGEFTTFAPRLVSTADTGDAKDVAVAGGTAAVVGASGLTVVDVSAPASPSVASRLPMAGGAAGVAVRAEALVDRTGTSRPGPIAVVASGDASGTGRAEVISLAAPGTPARLGQALLTTAPGQPAPQGVPAAAGTPSSVALGEDGRASVAVEGLGVSSLRVADAVPDDPANPGRALGPRYPASGADSSSQAALVGDQILSIGPAGLTVLDAQTLLRRGSVAIQNAPAAVTGASPFGADLNGNGTIASDERLDLGVVAGGADGTVQFYRLPFPGNPELISLVRLQGTTTAVTLDAERGLAFVGRADRGVAIVDLQGPASVQPIDVNRDGTDDRLLGTLDTPGSAGRIALTRGLAFVADGPSGLAILQVQPPRTRFISTKRDPLAGRPGDEEELADGDEVFTSDEAITVSLDASVPPQASLSLVVDEQAEAGGPKRLAFGDGGVRSALTDGVNQRTIAVARDPAATGAIVSLRVVTGEGAVVAERRLRLVPATLAGLTVQGLRVAPERVTIGAGDLSGRLSVAAILSDGRLINVTGDPATRFVVDAPLVAEVVGGAVLPRAGGTTSVFVSFGDQRAEAVIVVNRLPAVAAFLLPTPHLTLTGPGQSLPLGLRALLTTGQTEAAAGFAEFASSDTAVATVDAFGNVTAVAEGTARITARAGTVTFDVNVAVEFRTPPVLTGLTLTPLAEVTTDVGVVEARAVIAGSGSLEGLPVRFEVAGQSVFATAQSGYDGGAIGTLRGLTLSGTFEVRASVTNPATGAALVATASLVVRRGGEDAEPNDSPATATPVLANARVTGSLGGGDTRDVFQTASNVPGALEVILALAPGTDPAAVRVIVFDAGGNEIARFTPAAERQKFSVPAQAGRSFVAVESTGPTVTYAIQTRTIQAPLTIASVDPLAGGPGTPVTIVGTGFSTDPAQTHVYFAGAMGKVVSATATRIDVLVPALGMDGPLRVVSLGRDATGPRFTVGATTRPPVTVARPNRAALRLDPVSGVLIDPTRLIVAADPVATRGQIEALVAPLGGTVVGAMPAVNTYLVSFGSNASLAGIAALQRQLSQSPLVRRTAKETYGQIAALANDTRDRTGTWGGTDIARSDSYAQVRLFEALEAVRDSPNFTRATDLSPVKIVVVDTGFNPQVASEFQFNGQSTVQLFQIGPDGTWDSSLPFADLHGHGTAVTGIIGARNDGRFMSGVFTGLFKPDEQPPTIDVYSMDGGHFPMSLVQAALLQAAGGPVDVVNLSLRTPYLWASDEYVQERDLFIDVLALFAGKTLVVAAAGNEGIDSRYMLPGSLASDLPFVMSVGATAVNNLDGSGEAFDQRAVWGYRANQSQTCDTAESGAPFTAAVEAGAACNPAQARMGSNCGPTVTLAAPGEDVLMPFDVNPCGLPYRLPGASRGTSMATPIVAGVAAILQSIRPNATPIDPLDLRNLIVDSADDISTLWDNGAMRRLNTLNAVRALLPPSGNQMIYVSDQEAPGPGGGTGLIVGIDVDPFTGQQTLPARHVQIPLRFTAGGVQFEGTRPTALAVAPAGETLYALVRSVQPDLGDGILIVNTLSNEAAGFLPLSGASFPPPSGGGGSPSAQPTPVRIASLRPGMVVSRDGRLLYVAAGLDLVILNLAEGKLVQTFADLPAAYNVNSEDYPVGALATAKGFLRAAGAAGVAGRPGVAFTGLALSPDGTRLYAGVSTGGGGGTQPGGVLEIIVGLYDDTDPTAAGLQSDLSFYLAVPAEPSPLVNAGGLLGGDEPGGIATSGDGQNGGRTVYAVNGGLNFFEAIPPDNLDLQRYTLLMLGPAFVSSVGALGGVRGLAASLGSFLTVASPLYDELLLDIQAQARSGVTFIGAPGVTGVFDMNANRSNVWSFTSDVGFGWNPSPANGGAIVNQFRFQDVFAKRPFDITVRRDGRRAIVPFFQTGNFGVLDLDAQKQFENPPASTAKPGIDALPDLQFQGFVATTPALLLDNHLWPRRGAWTAGTQHVPSPDENLLYAWDAEYAQNGYFAVGSHVGVGAPRTVSAPLPDFVRNLSDRYSLQRLGATFSDDSVSWDEGDVTISGGVGTVVNLQRGGGAISIISDTVIDDEFSPHLNEPVTGENGTQRPYFATRPVAGAVTSVVKYRPSGGDTYLHRPRGVTIQPFVGIEAPRFGDFVTERQPVQVLWRDARVDMVRMVLSDPAAVDEFGDAPEIGPGSLVSLTADQRAQRTLSVVLGDLLPPNVQLQRGRTYRIEARARVGDDLLSLTHVDVTFDQPPPEPEPAATALRLTPRLNFFVAVPTAAGREKVLTLVRLDGNGVVAEDLSASADVTWRTLTSPVDPILAIDVPGFGTFESIIRDRLAANGLTIPFGKATVEVVNGKLRALTAGVQAVQGCLGQAQSRVCSNYIFVVAGLELDSIELRPQSVFTGLINAAEFAANNLTERFKDLEVNPPMILAADDTSIALDKGTILLHDVKFKFLGGPATLGLQDLFSAISNVLQAGGPFTFKEEIAFELIKLAVGDVGGQFPTYVSADPTVAGMISDWIPGLINKVQSGRAGVTQVTGTLNLDQVTILGRTFDIGLGEASDDVVVWVLPQLRSAEIRENPTVIPVDSDPLFGPSIRTFATVDVITSATLFEVPQKYESYAEFVDSILPPSWRTWGPNGREYVFGDGFKVSIGGQVNLDQNGHKITLTGLSVGFDAPNAIVDYDLAGDTSINPLADAENFLARIDEPALSTSAQVQHKNVVGQTTVSAEVSLPAMGSAAAQATIAVVGSQVQLRPKLIFVNDGPDCAVQLKVVTVGSNGQETDVTDHSDTAYFSLRQAIDQGLPDVLGVPTALVQAAVNAAAAKIRQELQAAGVNVPFAHGRVSIDATGRLTVDDNGIELIWARHKGKGSNFSIVLAGFKLSGIDLQPLSLLTVPTGSETGQALIEKINEAFDAKLDINAPMVLINSDPQVTGSFLTRNGMVILRDIEFQVLGQSKIAVRGVLGAIEDFVKPGLGAATLPQKLVVEAFFELIEAGMELTATQLVDFEMEAGADVADVRKEIVQISGGVSVAPKGLVTATAPGIAVVKGTLKLETPICNLGQGEDSVKVLVLPRFETLELKPKDTVISRQCSGADPVAKVKSIVCTEQFASRTVQIPQGVRTAAEYVEKLLPDDFRPPLGGSITKSATFPAGDFEFRLEGTVSASLSQVGFQGLRACFTVPNGVDGEPGMPPFITNEYGFDDPSVAQLQSPPPATTGFAAFVQGLQSGETEIDNHFELVTVSSLDAAGTVTVVDAQCQVTVDKGVLVPGAGATTDANGNHIIAPGATVTYRVRVGNTGTAALENLTINEVATLTGQPALPQPIVSTCVQAGQAGFNSCFIPRLEPNEILDFDVTVLVPAGARCAQLCNTATVNGQSAQVCNATACTGIRVTKALIDPGTGTPNPSIDPSGAPVLKPGESVRYRVTVENTGTGTEQNIQVNDTVRVVDPLPVAPAAPFSPPAFPVQIPSLGPGASQSVEFTVVLPADCSGGSRIENTATTAGSAATTLHFLDCAPNLQITKRLIDPPVADGAPIAGTSGSLKRIRYQIRVHNDGTGWARNVTVSDDLQLEDQNGARTSLNPPGPPLGCNLGDIAPGRFAECPDPYRFEFAFGSEANGRTLVNTATEDSTGRQAVTRHPVREPRLRLTKEIVSPAPGGNGASVVPAGTTAIYRITLQNVSNARIENVQLADTPLIVNVQTGQLVFTPSNRLITVPSLEPGEVIEDAMRVEVPAGSVLGPLAGLKLYNRVEVTNITGIDPVEVTSDIVASDLRLEKVLVEPAGAGTQDLVRGSYAEYEIRVSNTGTATAQNVIVTDVASIPGEPVFPANAVPVPFPLGDIAPGQTATQRVRFLVPHKEEFAPTCGPGLCVVTLPRLTNVATLLAANPPAWTVTNDVVNPQLRVQKALIDPPPGPNQAAPVIVTGSAVTYLVTVENLGTVTARDVVLRDRATLGATNVFDASFTLGTLAPGQSRVQQVRFTVPTGLAGTLLVNDARVNYQQQARAETQHAVVPPTVVLRKTLFDPGSGAIASPGQPTVLRAGDTVTYRVQVTNTGTAATTALTITDQPSLEVRGANGSVTGTPLASVTVSVPGLAAGQTFTTSVPMAVQAGTNGQALVNRASLNLAGGPAVTTEHPIVEPGPNGLLITEMVIDPRQDWSDSGPSNVGGDQPFDDRPGNGAVDSGDVWVEIATPVTATQDWRVVLTDATGATFSRTFGAPPAAASSPVRVLSGFGAMVLPIVRVEVIDQSGTVRQSIDVPALQANFPEITGPENESLAWSVFGPPTPVIQQFVRRPATIDLFLPF